MMDQWPTTVLSLPVTGTHEEGGGFQVLEADLCSL